jgi:uroporphyrinogen decarboxylase
MSALERLQRVLARRRPDRPPVSLWCHFPPDRVWGRAAVQAHLDHLAALDLDFLKVMNDNRYPHTSAIASVQDLASVTELRGDEDEFARQLALLADLRAELRGRVPMVTTVFNAWAVLRHLVRPPTSHRPPELDGAADEPSRRIREFYAADPDAVRGALQRIATSLGKFARRCLAAGADGIFLSVRDDWVEVPGQPQRYAELVRPTDLEILSGAAGGWFNMLHVCGRAVDFRALAAYPVHALNWADRAAGPAIAEVKDWLGPAICAGVDNLGTLVTGTPVDCEREVTDALRQAGDRPIVIAPGCTYDPARVPKANLEAVCRAARGTP